jgi:hypothetical protein
MSVLHILPVDGGHANSNLSSSLSTGERTAWIQTRLVFLLVRFAVGLDENSSLSGFRPCINRWKIGNELVLSTFEFPQSIPVQQVKQEKQHQDQRGTQLQPIGNRLPHFRYHSSGFNVKVLIETVETKTEKNRNHGDDA